jgi:hypothetical protein
MVCIICFIAKAQISYMGSLEEFKVIEILCVSTFHIICTSNFDTKGLHSTMEIPWAEKIQTLSTIKPHDG